MMTGKSVKDIDRYQAVLNSLLALEENKFCADCESKGPRWASWNLGIFVCIRCAGIHRNLGVHISKVKSVNLDQWTQEQIQCVQEMGNAKARRLYEAFLPECFQRPETDQSAEIFIRDKYDRKKYMDKVIDIQMLRKEKSCDNIPKEPVVFEKMKLKREASPRTQSPSVTDLLGLDGPSPSPAVSNGAASRLENKGSPSVASALDLFNPLPASSSASNIQTAPVSSSMPRVAAASVPDNLSLFLDPAAKAEEGTVKKLSKDSILSLYASAPSVSAHAGLYMHQMGYPTHPYGSYHHSLAQAAAAGGAMGGSMMASQMAMAGAQQQQGGMMSAVLPQSAAMMGGQAPGVMSGMVQGMMGVQQNSMLGQQQQQQQGMLGQQQQLGGLGGPHHQPHGYGGVQQQSQQLQWNIAQMTQHVAGMNFYGATNAMNGYSGQQHMNGYSGQQQQHMGAPTTQNPTQMAAQVWK